MLNQITPVILTFNESSNIQRSLDRLNWAADIVIVDSYSTDDTVELIKKYPQARLFQRDFDCHANQWNFAISETSIYSEWVLALDADYILEDALVNELDHLEQERAADAYSANFRYCVLGKPLSGTLYAPVTVLYRRDKAIYIQDGHTQRVQVDGDVGRLKMSILHDDRKPLSSWLRAQDKYMQLETDLLWNKQWRELSIADKIRKLIVISPIAVFFYCLLVKRGLFDGRVGLYYAIQRSVAEAILSLRLLEKSISKK
ncbi:MAG: glycosyltransferase family 2 protein [Gammaproteobacteria bacterium]|nr:glycosyltransferase family 2 protein [Gammaproteobacteria bacterium]MDH3464838.1 glycosyltransferase family 2 protein [Gammaproteobacteria bacterium]